VGSVAPEQLLRRIPGEEDDDAELYALRPADALRADRAV